MSTLRISAKTWAILAAALSFSSPCFGAFETNGDLDLTFNAGKLTNGQVTAAALQADGKLVIGGQFGKVNETARFNIARLNADGSLDTGFNTGTGPDGGVTQVILQTDGKIIIVGVFFSVNGFTRAAGIARLNTNGSVDSSYDPGSLITSDGVVSGGVATNPGNVAQAVLQSDGKVVVVGQFVGVANGATTFAARSCVARFDSTGAFDSTHNPGTGCTSATTAPFASFAVKQSSGKIILQGNFDHFNGNAVPGLARLNTNGSYDGTFTVGTGPSPINSVAGLFVQSDDKVIVFGQLTAFNGTSCNEMARLNVDGPVDAGFTAPVFHNFAYPGIVESVGQQPDGKLFVGGLFYSIGSTPAGSAARLKTDGSLDITFDSTGSKSAGETLCFVVRASDSHVFLGGTWGSYGGDDRYGITLTNSDGSLDNNFLPTKGVSDYSPQIFSTLVQTDGKIIIGGVFNNINGQRRYNLARLFPDGSLDTGFGVSFGASRSVRAMAVQSTGKIIVVGSFYAIDGVPCGHVARLNADGTLDGTFNPGIGADNIVYAVTVDASDNIYIGGAFSSVNGTPRVNLAKLQPNGTFDPMFDPAAGPGAATGAAADVRALAPPTASTGLLVGGFFTTYNGATVNRIVRVNATSATRDTTFTTNAGTAFNSTVRALSLSPDGKYYAGGSFSLFNGTGRSRVARLNSDGTLDTTFVPPSTAGSGFSILQQNGKLVAGGTFASLQNSLIRYSSTGPRDTTLVTGTGVTGADLSLPPPTVTALATQADGKMLIGGIFTGYNGVTRYCIARLTDSTLRITGMFRLAGPVIRLTGTGHPSTLYSLQISTTTPDAANFSPFTLVGTDANGDFTYDDSTNASANKLFYRLSY